MPLQKRSQYYQEKIKRLLVREDVQECLVGKKSNPRASGLQRELARVAQHAPDQATALLSHYHTHLQQQEALIQNNLERQRHQLDERIRRRSSSKHKDNQNREVMGLPVPVNPKRSILAYFWETER